MTISRRRFLGSAAAISLGFTGLGCSRTETSAASLPTDLGLGPLVDDPEGIIALPEGFGYRITSRRGERMDDGFFVPHRHDGMATFPGPDGMTLLVRNHEAIPGDDPADGAFGVDLPSWTASIRPGSTIPARAARRHLSAPRPPSCTTPSSSGWSPTA